MSRYIGKICPYCKSPMTDLNDIVVCSRCDMPHHKGCWIDNQGCTTFGCDGTISAPRFDDAQANDSIELDLFDSAPNVSREFVFCHKCGARTKAVNNFCPYCGTALIH